MTFTQLFILFIAIQLIHGLGTWKLYVKAGRKAWEAFVPIYNAVVLMKIINRPWYWVILMILPVVNLIMLPVVWVETARSFGKNSAIDTFLAIVSLGFYNFYLNYVATDIEHIKDRSLHPRTPLGDWVSSILFAIVAATIVHTYVMQPYIIPSSSLEKSLLIGDFLFVSKFHYGARVPMTSVALPMVHDTIPFTKSKSYLFDDRYDKRNSSWKNMFQLPYMRLPGFQKIKRNDYVVFNQPADTLLDMNNFHPDRNYYKPIDKKTNLVKRCVAIAGDTLSIVNGDVYVDGKLSELPDRAKLQYGYQVQPKTSTFSPRQMKERYDVTDQFGIINQQNTYYFSAIKDESVAKFKNHPNVGSIEKRIRPAEQYDPNTFPHDPRFPWNVDNFGPLYIPKKGSTITLTVDNLPLYKRAITEYEGNTLSVNGNQIKINDAVTNTYTFKQDYYWMMGDNRHNSLDARAWGLVPFSHVVGKPVFIWMSFDNFNAGIKNWAPRWERFFTNVHGTGKPISFLIPFLVFLAAYFGYSAWRKRKSS